MTNESPWERFLASPTEETFAPVYESTCGHVRAICIRRLGAAAGDDIDDAFQNAYARLLAWAKSGEGSRAPSDYRTADAAASRFAWLEADRLRQQRRRRKESPMDMSSEGSFRDAADVRAAAQERETAGAMRALLEELPEFDRLCVQLHYFDGMTHREIGLATGLPQPTVSTRIRRALGRLQQMAQGRGLREAVPALLAIAGIHSVANAAGPAPAASAVFKAASAGVPAVMPSLEVPGAVVRTVAQIKAHGTLVGTVLLVLMLGWLAVAGVAVHRAETPGNAVPPQVVDVSPSRDASLRTPSPEDAAVAIAEAELQARSQANAASRPADIAEGTACCVSVVGFVARAADGEGIPGARVRFATLVEGRDADEAEFGDVLAGAEGSFTATVLDGQGIFAVASAPGFAPKAAVINPGPQTLWAARPGTEDKTPQLVQDFALEPEAFLSGTVLEADGSPARDVEVALNPRDHSPAGKMIELAGLVGGPMPCDASGAFRFGELVPGEFRLTVTRGAQKWGPFLKEAPAEGIELRLTDEASSNKRTIAGLVVDSGDEPVEGATVVWRSPRAQSTMTFTDARGIFRLAQVPDEAGEIVAYNGAIGSAASMAVGPGNVGGIVLKLSLVDHVVLVGTVYKGDTDEPVVDYTVRDEGRPQRSATYGPDGEFRIDRIQRGSTVALVIEAQGYPPLKPEALRVDPGPGAAEHRAVYRMHPDAHLTGRIVARGEPVAGAKVSHEGLQNNPWRKGREEGRHETATDSAGRFEFAELAAGVHVFTASASGYMEKKFYVTMPGSDVEAGDIVLSGGSTVSVHVYDEASNRPLAGTPVTIDPYWGRIWSRVEDQSATTDANGMATFAGLFTSDHSINLERQRLIAFRRVEPDETITIELPVGTGSISGRALWGTQPIMGSIDLEQGRGTYSYRVSISINPNDGSFETPGSLTAGTWRLGVRAQVPEPQLQLKRELDVKLEQGENLQFDIVFPANSVAGIVVDGDGELVADALVEAVPSGPDGETRKATTGADGRFVISALPAGATTVTARHADKGEGSVEVSLVDGQMLPEQRIVLGDASTGSLASCTSRLVDGAPLGSAWIEMFPLSEGAKYLKSQSGRDAGGCTTVHFIPAGKYAVEVTGWGYSIARRNLEIVAGETVSIDDVLYDAGAVRWTLRNPDGTGVANHPCTIRPVDPSSISPTLDVRTNGEGVAIFRGLFPGNHVGTTEFAGQTLTAQFNVQVREVSGATTTVPAATDAP